MFSSSIILYSISKLICETKKAYDESFLSFILNKIFNWITRLANRSFMIQFMRSNISFEKPLDNSQILRRNNYNNKVLLVIKEFILKAIGHSFILRFLININAQVYMFIVILLSFPFVPTSLALILSVATILLTIISTIYKDNKLIYAKLYLFFISLFLISIVISSIFNSGPAKSMEVFLIYMVFISLGLIIPLIINDKTKLKLSLNALVFITTLLCIYGIYQFIFGAPMDEAWIDKGYASNVTRIYSVFGNPNVYGEYLVLVIPVVFALFNTTKNKLLKLVYLIVIGLGILNTLLTLSRGSMVSLVIALVIVILLKAQQYIPILVILAMASPFILPPIIITRIISIFAGDSSTDYRTSIYQASFNMLRDNYVTGVGLGQFKELYKIYSFGAAKSFHAHNTILMIFIETGLLGLISFVFMMIAWARDIITAMTKKKNVGFIEVSIMAGIIGCSIQGMVDHIWHNYDIMLIYFVLLGIGSASASLSMQDRGVTVE